MALLDIEKLTFTYPNCYAPAISDVSLRVERGEFLAVCGATGSGKSTLLRLIKRELAPLGELSGTIRIGGIDRDALTDRDAACRIGYVMQRPEQQIVTDKVWHELAFGLENMGVPQREMSRRVAEMAAYFGIESWFEKDVSALSGGQKQLLNLASVMVMQPEILIMDEPTAQLDPIAAQDFIATVHRLNRELGLTVLIIEHRLEDVIPLCSRLLVLEEGRVLHLDAPRRVISRLGDRADLLCAMPAAARVFHALQGAGECPLSIREGRDWLNACTESAGSAAEDVRAASSDEALSFRDVSFRYERSGADVLRGMSFAVQSGEIVCMLGGNGSGKSTALSVASALRRPWGGTVRVFDRKLKEYRNQSLYRECLTLLPQDVQTVFLHDTVRDELKNVPDGILPVDFAPLMEKHPYDLSGGEQQLLALAKVLATRPRLLLLDEPTKGIDAVTRHRLMEVLRQLCGQGLTLLIVTHDVDFAAELADRCLFVFRGQVVSDAPPRQFFSANSFYTTAVSRMTRGLMENAVTVADVARQRRTKGGCGA